VIRSERSPRYISVKLRTFSSGRFLGQRYRQAGDCPDTTFAKIRANRYYFFHESITVSVKISLLRDCYPVLRQSPHQSTMDTYLFPTILREKGDLFSTLTRYCLNESFHRESAVRTVDCCLTLSHSQGQALGASPIRLRSAGRRICYLLSLDPEVFHKRSGFAMAIRWASCQGQPGLLEPRVGTQPERMAKRSTCSRRVQSPPEGGRANVDRLCDFLSRDVRR
jgi:hypothetical protein